MATREDWAADKAAFAVSHGTRTTGPLARQFAELTQRLLNAGNVADVLAQVVAATHGIVPGADMVSVTLRSPDGALGTRMETDEVAVELDRLQYENDEGPCLDVIRAPGSAVIRSDDVATEPVWPRFGPAAARRGVHAVLAVALLPAARPPLYSGALNIYSRSPGGLDAPAYEAALLLATHASLALARTTGFTLAELRAAQLHRAIDSRDVIGQAKGILMQRHGIDADGAFELLRRAAQDLNVKLSEIARTLTSGRVALDEGPEGTAWSGNRGEGTRSRRVSGHRNRP
jgi:hypothetical protein